MAGQHHLLVFAKVPFLGQVKTRLESAIGIDGAQAFAINALSEILHYFAKLHSNSIILNSQKIKCVWCYAPSSASKEVKEFLEQRNLTEHWETWPQEDKAIDLGARLSAAVQKANSDNAEHGITCTLIGADCFHLTMEHVKDAMKRASKEGHSTILPARDGGYVMLSLPQPISKHAFDNIRWSTAQTGQDQQKQLKKLGHDHLYVGETLPDVDEPSDLQIFSSKQEVPIHLKINYPLTLAFVQETMNKQSVR